MNSKTKRLILLSALALLSACSREVAVEDAVEMPRSVYHATFENFDTKIYSDASLQLLWNANDRISMFPKTTCNKEYKFLGTDGAAYGDFELVPKSYGSGTAISHNIAVYPYAAANTCSTGEQITLDIPAAQIWRANTFGRGAAVLLSCSNDDNLYFRHLGGYLAIKISGAGRSVSSIELKSNGGETLSGPMNVHFEGSVPVGEFDTNYSCDSITLMMSDPVALGTEPVTFWFAVPAVSLPGGFTVTVSGSDGWVQSKSTDKSTTFERGKLQRMKSFAFDPHPTAPGIYHQGQDPILFPRLTTQANVYEAESQFWSRYLVPSTLSVYQLGPIPEGIEVGDVFNSVYTVISEGVEQGHANVTLEVVAVEGGYATLISEAKSYFVVKI